MPEVRKVVSGHGTSSENVAKGGWGLLLVWIGTALLLHLGWGVGLVGAGTVVLATQAARKYLGMHLDMFGIVVGALLLACGVWNLFDASVRLLPLLCIGAGVGLLASTWTGLRRARAAGGGQADRPAVSHPPA